MAVAEGVVGRPETRRRQGESAKVRGLPSNILRSYERLSTGRDFGPRMPFIWRRLVAVKKQWYLDTNRIESLGNWLLHKRSA